MIKTGGKWDPKDWPKYFVATNPEQLALIDYNNKLLAVNELEGNQTMIGHLSDMLDRGDTILLDSGVFNLASTHASKHKVTHNEALGMSPDDIDGFKELLALYISTVKRFRDKLWGYIEIDQGGRENKIKTRAKLEKLGLRPIPVYHPLNDGWDYFDYLAKRYDRICFGNVVNADPVTRKKLAATAWERRRKFPNLWIHLLGLTPSHLTVAFPSNSCDSSTWIGSLRWARMATTVATGPFSNLGLEFAYEYAPTRTGGENKIEPKKQGNIMVGWSESYVHALKMCAFDASIVQRNMTQIAADQKAHLGADIGMFQ